MAERKEGGTKIGVFRVKGDPSRRSEERTIRLHKERIVIGAVVSADVRLSGEGISPIHAVVELHASPSERAGVATVFDLASETGIHVNGKKVVTASLKQGDELRIGPCSIEFTVEDIKQFTSREKIRETAGRKLFLNPGEDLRPLLLEEEREVREIFDYRPAGRRALEVVMSWRGTIMDVRHFVARKSITIGNDARADFGIPPFLSSARFPIVSRGPDGLARLSLDTRMKGVMQRRGTLLPLEEVRAQGTPSPHGTQVPLEDTDFAKISIGDIDFYLSNTSAPPKVKSSLRERDPLFLKTLLTSLALTAAIVVTFARMEVQREIEAEELPDRIVSILYQPEKYTAMYREPAPKAPPEAPKKTTITITPRKDVPAKRADEIVVAKPRDAAKPGETRTQTARKRDEGRGQEGAGARAKGPEGRRGRPGAGPSKTPQDVATRPSPEGGTGRGTGRSQVPDQGNIDVLKGATRTIQDLLGNAAERLGKGGERLRGFGGFTTEGRGGLALEGGGSGGGGTATTTLGGAADAGKGGGRVGTGKGAAGQGGNIIGGQGRMVKIRTGGPEEAIVMGAIDADAVEAALLAHKDEFRLCYEREINAETPDLAGRVGTSFVIGPTGRVTRAGVLSSSLGNRNVEGCILTVIRRIDFPKPRGGGIVQVQYPFKFTATGT